MNVPANSAPDATEAEPAMMRISTYGRRMAQHLEINQRLFEDERFSRDKCGPAGGHTLLVLLTRAAHDGVRSFTLDAARELCRAANPAEVIDTLIAHGFLRREGAAVFIDDQPTLWRIA